MESIKYAYQGFAKQNYTMLDNLKLGKLLKCAKKIFVYLFFIAQYKPCENDETPNVKARAISCEAY